MEICLKTDGGQTIPLQNVENIDGNGIVIAYLNCVLSEQYCESMEIKLSKKLGRRVVLLDGRFSKLELLGKDD